MSGSERPGGHCATIVALGVIASLVAIALPPMVIDAQAQTADGITVRAVFADGSSAADVEITLTSDVEGCPASQTLSIPAGQSRVLPVPAAVVDPPSFQSNDFELTPVFGNVVDFDFTFDMDGGIAYFVRGTLDGTPSGFPAFDLVRDITFDEFAAQGTEFELLTIGNPDFSDGLQLAELDGPDPVFVLNLRELDTGRYHPPIVELRSDGTGRIQNSRNLGGVNPATGQVVDVQPGEEYITDLSFDPATLTLAEGRSCAYSINQSPVPGYILSPTAFTDVSHGQEVTFVNTPTATECMGRAPTIDMRTNGGIGQGTAGDDVIIGTAGPDMISAGPGNDLICAGPGDDTVHAGVGNDRVLGGDGDDTVHAGVGNDFIFGEGGNDRLFGSQGIDEISGGPGADTIHGNRGADRLLGDGGDDRIFGYADDDIIVGGAGNDRLHGNFGDDIIEGGDGDDRIFGYGGDDVLDGKLGDDLIVGNRGGDVIRGGAGNDTLFGSDGDDEVHGNSGDDLVNGNSLNDIVTGGPGDDILDGGIGVDDCNGGPDVDTATRCETSTGISP